MSGTHADDSSNAPFVEDEDLPDEENARRYFGFVPLERFDALTLRARKKKKDDLAQSLPERELAQRYFDLLAPSVGIAPAARAPQEQVPAAPPLRAAPPPPAAEPTASAGAQHLLERLEQQLHHALYADVIEHTIVVYDQLFRSMTALARILGVRPNDVRNAWVRRQMAPPEAEDLSGAQLEKVLELFPEGLHLSLAGTPEYNHPAHRYIANAREARPGLQFESLIDAIRAQAREQLGH